MDFNKKKAYIINTISIIVLYLIFFVLIQTKIMNNYFIGIAILTGIMIIMAMSLNIVAGFLGEMALGHAGFMAIGAYASASFSIAVVDSGVALPNIIILVLAMIVGGVVSGIFGFLIGTPTLRLRGDYLGIVTIGFSEIIRIFFINFGPTGGAAGLKGIARLVNFNNVYWITIVVAFLIFTLGRSKHGRAIISIREDEIASEAAGIPTTRYKVLAFSLAAFFAGIGGALYAHYQSFLEPSKFGFMFSIEMFVIVVLGGLGSLTGSIVSAIVLTVLPEMLRSFSEYRLLVYSLVLIIMMIFRPQGIFGRSEFSLTAFIESLIQRKNVKKSIGGGEAS
ncbi:branched-chain amino acid ABC transporter permease [Acetobacterium woodii]|uniref:Branched-chain amino acid transport system permease protein LivM1 n=1 Tax=Acetobacterium woodii (strain ATCC 29683 / DSM 1030 / JCM 2381 / KCTC 1655 / WB1) TaxID=931626 RepID=H6LC19_ACEWD|nr:branched-chain amino acid ABC transporter permease [Acetobacterium woodii]AFA48967.1 branched-chain amino acid transport system permease protein LivM1 [Acetobacterium woodii DSM 1030]